MTAEVEMYAELEMARARAREAREEYEQILRDRGSTLDTNDLTDDQGAGEPPSERPTTFSDCAALWDRAGLEWRISGGLGELGYFTQAAEHAATAADLEVSAASCDASASGQIIEL
jgi:hypothetical protein